MSLGGVVLFCQCTRYIFFKPLLASFCLGELFLNLISMLFKRITEAQVWHRASLLDEEPRTKNQKDNLMRLARIERATFRLSSRRTLQSSSD